MLRIRSAEFTEEQAEAFLKTANRCGLFNWDGFCGEDTGEVLNITFADGSAQNVECVNTAPYFGKVREALFALLAAGTEIRKTGESPDMLRSIRYEGGGYLAGSVSLTVDFSAYTTDRAFSDSWDGSPDEPTERYTASFTAAQAQTFLQTANDCNLFGWDEYYYADVEDGGWDKLTVEFADGTVQTVFCGNAYPPDFDILRDALFNLAK